MLCNLGTDDLPPYIVVNRIQPAPLSRRNEMCESEAVAALFGSYRREIVLGGVEQNGDFW